METQQHKITYYQDESVKFVVEFNEEGVFLHCDVFDWKPSSLKRYYRVFGNLLEELKQTGVKQIMTVTPNPKFARLFGGRFEKELYFDGIRNEVIVWEVVH